jgi:hypothetical protein
MWRINNHPSRKISGLAAGKRISKVLRMIPAARLAIDNS